MRFFRTFCICLTTLFAAMPGAAVTQTTDGLGRTTSARGGIFSKDLPGGQTYDGAGRLYNHRTANDLVTGPRNELRLHLDAMGRISDARGRLLAHVSNGRFTSAEGGFLGRQNPEGRVYDARGTFLGVAPPRDEVAAYRLINHAP
ncbi:hypothetical protein N5W20_00780 [Candidatus Kirkpatrickella diaphorinae]|uniref:Uncharacterized protein n=1 Tax=Candidatus Kirkpatrickella diaphorinae TaxID=2984322 RepID=A0ABY6GLB6_9PROT|nr:hypothetical protein [Candidatus Kirkpatrickella diaphorinae]UYH51451.1 hypothetical protein N5W20_00780 [Candidatus Kirkpatrickella diaphorinae]